MKQPTEHQVGFLHWFQAQYLRVMIFAIPNGEKRSISVAKRLKAEGVMPGVPDLFIPEWSLWVEMKRAKGGRLSDDQRQVIARLEQMGHFVIIGRGAEDASRQVRSFELEQAAIKRGAR